MGNKRNPALLAPAFFALGLALVAPAAGLAQAGRGEQTVVTDAGVEPVNAGFNPNHAAVEVTGDVLLGSNSCVAAGNTAELVQRRRGKSIVVVPVVRKAPDDGRVCIQIYDPVYVTLSTAVRANAGSGVEVYVANVDELGTSVKVHAFR